MKFKDVLKELPPHDTNVFVQTDGIDIPLVAKLNYHQGWIFLSNGTNLQAYPLLRQNVLGWYAIEIEKGYTLDTFECKICAKLFLTHKEMYEHYDFVHNKGNQE